MNDSIGCRSSSNAKNASCFSAVSPVCGWNQCVKWVTPREIAHSLMTCATTGAIVAIELLAVADGRGEAAEDFSRKLVAQLPHAEDVDAEVLGSRAGDSVLVEAGRDAGLAVW